MTSADSVRAYGAGDAVCCICRVASAHKKSAMAKNIAPRESVFTSMRKPGTSFRTIEANRLSKPKAQLAPMMIRYRPAMTPSCQNVWGKCNRVRSKGVGNLTNKFNRGGRRQSVETWGLKTSAVETAVFKRRLRHD